jgi:hypothetical protein
MLKVSLPEASNLWREIEFRKEAADLLSIEGSDVLRSPMEEDLADEPPPLPGIIQIELSLGPDNIALHLESISSAWPKAQWTDCSPGSRVSASLLSSLGLLPTIRLLGLLNKILQGQAVHEHLFTFSKHHSINHCRLPGLNSSRTRLTDQSLPLLERPIVPMATL